MKRAISVIVICTILTVGSPSFAAKGKSWCPKWLTQISLRQLMIASAVGALGLSSLAWTVSDRRAQSRGDAYLDTIFAKAGAAPGSAPPSEANAPFNLQKFRANLPGVASYIRPRLPAEGHVAFLKARAKKNPALAKKIEDLGTDFEPWVRARLEGYKSFVVLPYEKEARAKLDGMIQDALLDTVTKMKLEDAVTKDVMIPVVLQYIDSADREMAKRFVEGKTISPVDDNRLDEFLPHILREQLRQGKAPQKIVDVALADTSDMENATQEERIRAYLKKYEDSQMGDGLSPQDAFIKILGGIGILDPALVKPLTAEEKADLLKDVPTKPPPE